jgi:hypothetical protein
MNESQIGFFYRMDGCMDGWMNESKIGFFYCIGWMDPSLLVQLDGLLLLNSGPAIAREEKGGWGGSERMHYCYVMSITT